MPLAEGGPSKKTNEGAPSLSFILFEKTSVSSHFFKTSLFTSDRSILEYSGNFLELIIYLVFVYF